MKKVRFTESQLRDVLTEVSLSADNALDTTGNIQTAVRDTIDSARNSGMNTDNAGVNVAFSADNLRKNGLAEEKEEEACKCECYTKKQLKEAKLNKMVAEAKAVFTKKQLMESIRNSK